MAAETSLSRLQNQVIKLEKENNRLRELLNNQKEKNKALIKKLNSLEKTMDEKIAKAVAEFASDLIKENAKLKEENERMRRILSHDSNNTGMPTSKTPIGKEKRVPNSREKSELPKGGQVGHSKSTLERFNDDEITDVCVHELENKKCTCGGELKLIKTRSKDEFEIRIILEKIRHEFGVYMCPCCGRIIEVPIPNNLKEKNQYGIHAQATAVSLVNEGYVSFHRTKELISGFTGGEMNMSEGYIAKLQKRCYQKLENFDNELHQEILKQKVLNWDDTAISINSKQACLRFYGTDNLAYYKAHERKNKEGLDDDAILQFLPKETVVVHDHNKVNYNNDYDFTNAECCVHLIRDLKELNENHKREWIDKMINLLVVNFNDISTNKLKNKIT